MSLIDIKKVQSEARKELTEAAMETAKEKLKDLYLRLEKSQLVTKNIQRDIDNYLTEISEMSVYQAAGVDTSK